MKEMVLKDYDGFEFDYEGADVCAGKFIDCLHNLKELTLRLKISPRMKSKLKTRGDNVYIIVTPSKLINLKNKIIKYIKLRIQSMYQQQ